MRRTEYIALSAATMMLTALGIDVMLPALSNVGAHFNLPAHSTETSKVIVFFFMGQVAQLVFGILSDRFGRIPILRTGFPLYILGGIAATFAPTLASMCAARFVAGVGASAVFMTTIAGVRDRFSGDIMASTLSLIFTIFLFTPILAPFLGMALLSAFSWQMVFLAPPIFAIIVFCWSFRLRESHLPDKKMPLHWRATMNNILQIMTNAVFARYTIITTLLFTALSTYVSASAYIVGEIYGQPRLFPWIFAAIGLAMAICTLINSRLSTRFGARRVIRSLLSFYTGIAVLLLLATFFWHMRPPIGVFFTGVGLLMAVNLAIEPNCSALALEPMAHKAGMASAVYGTFFFFIGSGLGTFITHLLQHGVWPLVISFVLFGTLSLLLSKRPRSVADRPAQHT